MGADCAVQLVWLAVITAVIIVMAQQPYVNPIFIPGLDWNFAISKS